MADLFDSDDEVPPPPPSMGLAEGENLGAASKKRSREVNEASNGSAQDDQENGGREDGDEADGGSGEDSSDGAAKKKKRDEAPTDNIMDSDDDEDDEDDAAKVALSDEEADAEEDGGAEGSDDEEDEDEDARRERKERKKKKKEKKREKKEKEKKKKKKKRLDVSRFFAETAEEGDDEDEEDVLDREDAEELDEAEAAAIARVEKRQALDEEMDKKSINDIADDIINRYKGGARAQRVAAQYGAGQGVFREGTLRQTTALPTNKDPPLWRIKVKTGLEIQLVRSILLKQIMMKKESPNSVGIHSCFSTATKGFIYVEAAAEPLARVAITGIRGIYHGTLFLIPVGDRSAVLSFRTSKKLLKNGQWCRMRRGPLKGDLVKVLQVLEGGAKALIQGVPRLDYSDTKLKGGRPAQALFSTEECHNAQVNFTLARHPAMDEQMYFFRNEYYKNGFLVKEVAVDTYLDARSVQPKLEELQLFRVQKTDDASDSDGEGAEGNKGPRSVATTAAGLMRDLADVVGDAELMDEANKKSIMPFVVGDLVQVTSGDFRNLVGTVVSVNELTKLVNMLPVKTAGVQLGVQQMEASVLVKYIKPGAHVKITEGTHLGQTGTVVSITRKSDDGGEYTHVAHILTDNVNTELTCNVDHLQLTTEIAAALSSLQGFQLYDLVMISSNEFAVITSVGMEYLTVINHQGMVKRVLPQELKGNGNRNAASMRATCFDAAHCSISNGDMVEVKDGPFAKKSGTVKHIQKSMLWLHSNNHLKDAGIFVVRSRVCMLAGKKGRTSTAGLMPPTAVASGAGGRRNGPVDPMIGKNVRITKGGHKGSLGRITGVDDTYFQVMLTAKLKQVTIERVKCKMADDMPRPGGAVMHGAPPTPYLVGETPLHTGSETPMVQGNETPLVTGSETPMGVGEDDDDDDDGAGANAGAGTMSAYGNSESSSWMDPGASTSGFAGASPASSGGQYSPSGSQYSPAGSNSMGWNSPASPSGGSLALTFNDWVKDMVMMFNDTSAYPNQRCVLTAAPQADGTVSVTMLDSDGHTLTDQTVAAYHSDLRPAPPAKLMWARVVRGENIGTEARVKVIVGEDLVLEGGQDLLKLSDIVTIYRA